MAVPYLGYHFTISPLNPGVEILLAQLEETAFESFMETETGLSAFVQKEHQNDEILNEVQILTADNFSISYTIEEIAPVNWNEEWEKNFEPIVVNELCVVRAPFHAKTESQYEIVIEPKMSFGTGHHETTHMMIQYLLELDLQDKKTLDMGCGTAILAILAEMKGAHPIDAIDIDNWCYQNSIENADRNNCKHISVFEGDVALLKNKKYDIIIANINRNILLDDISAYANCLSKEGILLLSGFYQEDIQAIDACCIENKLVLNKQISRNNWAGLKYIKQ